MPYKCAQVLCSKGAYHKEGTLSTPGDSKTLTFPHKISESLHKYAKGLTNTPRDSIVNKSTNQGSLMSATYQMAQKRHVRITLDLDVLGDFDARQIDWEKVFKLEPSEKVRAYVEDFDIDW